MRLLMVSCAFLLSSSAIAAAPCGHLSQLAQAMSCLRQVANAEIPTGSDGKAEIAVSGSVQAFQGIEKLIRDYTGFGAGSDLSVERREWLIKRAAQSEWVGLVIQKGEETRVSYFLLESGEAPVLVLEFSPSREGIRSFPTLEQNGDLSPFTLGLRGLDRWVYELFERD